MLNPDHIYQEMVKLGENWATLNAAAEVLEDTTKTTLAQLASSSKEATNAARETYALGHPEYREHIKSKAEARKAANRAKVQYDSYKVYAELMRTQAANERAANRFGA